MCLVNDKLKALIYYNGEWRAELQIFIMYNGTAIRKFSTYSVPAIFVMSTYSVQSTFIIVSK